MADNLLPNHWYSHSVQAELLGAGIKVPVYEDSLAKAIGIDEGKYTKKIGYIADFGDKSVDKIYDLDANPLAFEDPSKMCILITPPIPGFSYEKFMYGIEITNRNGELVNVVDGYLPTSFRMNARYVQEVALNTLQHHLKVEEHHDKFVIVGARLNPLSSGKANIAIFLKFERECPYKYQTYRDIPDSYLKIRIIPRPIIQKKSSDPIYNIEITVTVATTDDKMFDNLFNFCGNLMTFDIAVCFKHLRTVKNSFVIAGHSLKPIELSNYHKKNIIKKIQVGAQDYIVKDVAFKVF
jgi:hypothetical protein